MTNFRNRLPHKNADLLSARRAKTTAKRSVQEPKPIRKTTVLVNDSEDANFFTPYDTLRLLGAKAIDSLKIATPARYWGYLIAAGQLGMVFGWRGAGKSTFTLGLAVAMATGTQFLGFSPSRPVNTILLDGEMDLHSIQGRLRRAHDSLGVPLSNRFKLMSPELFSGVMPKLTTPEGQKQIDIALGNDWEVLIIDNYSAFSSGREDADAWAPWVPWLLKHKRAGRTIIIVHHTGKNGTQRGASNHEDAMDFVMSLRSPKVPSTDGSLEFVISWTKARHLSSKRTQPFQVSFRKADNGNYVWTKLKEVDANPLLAQAKEMSMAGKSQNEIAQALGKDKSTISRWLKA